MPGTEFPEITWLNKIWFDKWVHIGLLLVLVVTWCRYYKLVYRQDASLKKYFRGILIAAMAYGILMELVQHFFIPFRSFDVGDLLADAVGSWLGYLFAVRTFIKK
jgi:VanZ family protein